MLTAIDEMPARAAARVWLSLGAGVVGVVLACVLALRLVNWPVADMGGVVARMMILVLLLVQLAPALGLPLAWAMRRRSAQIWSVLFWIWLVPSLIAVAAGLFGALAFAR